jgi:spore germination protein YaaH
MWENHGVFEHLWIEDARSFMAKLAIVKTHNLRGYSVWVLGTEDPEIWHARDIRPMIPPRDP